jgi:hypothetical protein
MLFLVNSTPDRSPADAEQLEEDRQQVEREQYKLNKEAEGANDGIKAYK